MAHRVAFELGIGDGILNEVPEEDLQVCASIDRHSLKL